MSPSTDVVGKPDRHRAEELAQAVRASTGSRRTWRKVTTLLDLFGVYRLTPAVRTRIADALDAVGLVADPPLAEVERYGTVRLTLHDRASAGAPQERRDPGIGIKAIDVRVWRPGAEPQLIDAPMPPTGDAIIWIDVDITKVDRAEDLHAALAPTCGPSLTPKMVSKLLEVDDLPMVESLDDGIRNVTSFSVTPRESDDDADDAEASKAGWLEFQLVEFLAADRWIVSCWHKRQPTGDSAHEAPEQEPEDHSELVTRVSRRWRHLPHPRSAGDLGLAVLYELALSYTSARRVLWSWHESWEIAFDKQGHRAERETLRQLRGQIKALRRRLEGLNQTGMSRDPSLIWFDHVTDTAEAERVDDLIDRALADLRALNDVLRSSTELLASEAFAQQSRQAERFQELAGFVAAVLLVPTLVVGFFGANTGLPGKNAWSGFGYMAVAIVVSALATYLLIQRWRGRKEDSRGDGARVDRGSRKLR